MGGYIRRFVSIISFAATAYAFFWTLMYAIAMGDDFRYYFAYLFSAWTSPGEKPGLIQLYALTLTVISTLVYGSKK
jgi:hypothetical protein